MTFSPEYVRLVLTPNFEDAKALLLTPLVAIHYAHLAMLAEQGIVPTDEVRSLRAGLDGLDLEAIRRTDYDPAIEDLFFHVDRLLVDACGPQVAGRLHTARSRNDIDMTMYRWCLRQWLLDVAGAAVRLRRTVIGLASRHEGSVFAAHTHTQPAQPTTMAHYLLAVAEQLERDTSRLLQAFRTVNRCPLGACAITGTGFPIDRARTSSLLGFDGPTGNTYGSIAAVDYLLEAAAAAAITLVGIGRVVQDLLLWSTREVGYLRLADGFVQVSSIMPQKRNPVALEHVRVLASRAAGQLAAVPTIVHNTPFGDIVDSEDDLQPLVAAGFRDSRRVLELLDAALAGAEFDVDRMRAGAGRGWVTATELADSLVRDAGLPFAVAHALVAEVARRVPDDDPARVAATLTRVAEGSDVAIRWSADDVARVMDPDWFVRVRRTAGGPAPEETRRAGAVAASAVDRDAETIEAMSAALALADRDRRAAVDAI